MLAAALDPRSKQLGGIPDADQALVWDLLETEALSIAMESHVP